MKSGRPATIKDEAGNTLREISGRGDAEMNYVDWDLTVDVRSGGESGTTKLVVKPPRERQKAP